MVEKKAAPKPEPEKAPVKAEVVGEQRPELFVPEKAGVVVPKSKPEPAPEPKPEPVRAAGHVLTDDKGWVLEEE